jgi:hypothetical protein
MSLTASGDVSSSAGRGRAQLPGSGPTTAKPTSQIGSGRCLPPGSSRLTLPFALALRPAELAPRLARLAATVGGLLEPAESRDRVAPELEVVGLFRQCQGGSEMCLGPVDVPEDRQRVTGMNPRAAHQGAATVAAMLGTALAARPEWSDYVLGSVGLRIGGGTEEVQRTSSPTGSSACPAIPAPMQPSLGHGSRAPDHPVSDNLTEGIAMTIAITGGTGKLGRMAAEFRARVCRSLGPGRHDQDTGEPGGPDGPRRRRTVRRLRPARQPSLRPRWRRPAARRQREQRDRQTPRRALGRRCRRASGGSTAHPIHLDAQRRRPQPPLGLGGR